MDKYFNKNLSSIKNICAKYNLEFKNNKNDIVIDNDGKFKKYFIDKYSMILTSIQEPSK